MASIQHVYRRGHIFWWRRVLCIFGESSCDIRVSLGTADRRRARKLGAMLTAASGDVTMLVEERETIVGVQDLIGVEYARTRQVATGSWLGKAYQGHGIGKEMRAAVLHLAFAGLGAQRATSEAFEDNAASLAVSRALGYVENGDDIKVSRGRSRRAVRLVLHREVWQKNCRDDMQIQGLESCVTMFGLDRMDS